MGKPSEKQEFYAIQYALRVTLRDFKQIIGTYEFKSEIDSSDR